jgi:phosphoribosylformylglycinamidine cyclo-ligase
LGGQSLGAALLAPTQIYVKPILEALGSDLEIHGMAHITGGGLPENLPRCLGAGQSVAIAGDRWQPLPIFQWIAEAGGVSSSAMVETFNMGIGFVVLVPPERAAMALEWFGSKGLKAWAIGEVVAGQGELIWTSAMPT